MNLSTSLFDSKFFQKGSMIYTAQDSAENIYFIESGEVVLFTYQDKRVIPLSRLGKKDVFAESQILFDQREYSHFACAVADTSVVIIPKSDLYRYLSQKPSWVLDLLKNIGDKLCHTMDFISSHKIQDERLLKNEALSDSESELIQAAIKG